MIHLILDIIAYTLLLLITYQLYKQGAFKIVYHNLKRQLKTWYRTTYAYKITSGITTWFNHTFFKQRTINRSLKTMHDLPPQKGEKEFEINGIKINAKNRTHAQKVYDRILNLDVEYTKQTY